MIYSPKDRMADLMSQEPEVLQIISRFNLPVGISEKSIREVCEENHVQVDTFLAIVNYKLQGINTTPAEDLSLETLIGYLRQAHRYFFDFALPRLRRELVEAINYSSNSKIPMLIMKFFDEYVNEISLHMQHENEQMFPYIEHLLHGEREEGETIETFAHQHRAVDDQHIAEKLNELKQLIIKYYPANTENSLILSVLYDICQTERDLATHCSIEDEILIPAVRLREKHAHTTIHKHKKAIQQPQEELTEREKEVVIELVNGLSNKEIADKLCISANTVITHRKNIARKLNIRSVAGLTIYAIVNNLVDLSELK